MNPILGPEFEDLLRSAIDGPPEAVDWPRLEAILDENPEAMATYVELMTVHALLHWRAGASGPANIPTKDLTSPPSQDPVPAAPLPGTVGEGEGETEGSTTSPVLGFLGDLGHTGWQYFSGNPLLFSLVAMVGISLAVVMVFWGRRSEPLIADSRQTPEEVSQRNDPELPINKPAESLLSRVEPHKGWVGDQVAELTGVYSARWGGDSKNTALGAQLSAGRELQLEAGLAELTFKLGARVIVEAPARLRLTSVDSVHVLDGKVTVRADTDEARGFVVRSDVARMVDLGTEFGADIEDKVQTDLHVFQGMVEVSRNSDKENRAIRLTAGQRIVIRPEGNVEVPSMPADSNRFTRSLSVAENDYHRWHRWSQSTRKDPDVVGYYTFEPTLPSPSGRGAGGEGGLLNTSAGGSASAGTIRGPTWAVGRWPGKPALRFAQRDDRVRLNVPGSFPALTLAIWVNMDGLDNEYNGLLLSDGWKDRAGQCHWQLTRSGRMDFGINLGPGEEEYTVYRSTSLPETEDLGRWLHLAVTYDTAAGQVTFYADGRQVIVKPITVKSPLVLGSCDIGNWTTTATDPFAVRNFHGRIDELTILRRALSAAEVKNMYEEGKP